MNRRDFLIGASAGAGAFLAAGCQGSRSADVQLAMLADSVPAQLLQAFQQQPDRPRSVAVTLQTSRTNLYRLLQRWQTQPTAGGQAPVAQWLSLADYWLAPAIRQGLVQPVAVDQLSQWGDLAAVWGDLVRRNADGIPAASGDPWAVPYRWTPLVVLYDQRRLGQGASLTTWADLLRPELTRRLILPDHPRIVLGIAQKHLGTSANAANPVVAPLEDFLAQLHGQVRTYSSDRYLESLILGDVTAVVTWAEDALPVLNRHRHLAATIPPEGTLLSAQVWVQPQALPQGKDLALDWSDFCLGANFAEQLAIFAQGVSPRLWGVAPDQLPDVLRRSPTLLPPAVASRSEFLLPLPAATNAQYLDLWETMRRQPTQETRTHRPT